MFSRLVRRSRYYPIIIKNLWLGWQLKRRYHNPAQSMRIIGITGTDGKTTTAHLLQAILRADGRKVGLISTLGSMIDGQMAPTGLHESTPGPKQLYALLDQMHQAQVTDVILEVTSHGLDQRRVAGLNFDVAVVTNISPEHLDYHGTFEEYVQAKSRIVSLAAVSVLNAEDRATSGLATKAHRSVMYGTTATSMVRADQIADQAEGTNYQLVTTQGSGEVQLHLPGRYNVMNSLAAAGAALELGVHLPAITKGLAEVEGVAGRWEVLQQQPFVVIVDFAHTPQSFAQVLPAARSKVGPTGKLIHVFGCAADRDQEKRSEMGRLSGQLADLTVLTAEDPRFESLDRIQAMIATGLTAAGKTDADWRRLDDRAEAINWAIGQAQPGDVVIVTGKGHETSMAIQGQELPWSDQLVVTRALKATLTQPAN